MNRRRTVLPAALLLAAAACGGDAGAGGLGTGGGDRGPRVPDDVVVIDGTEASVTAIDNSFRAPDIEVQPGTTVTWENRGRNEHDVLPVEGDAWGADVEEFAPGATYSTTFDEPGVYPYYCSIHGTTDEGMVGTVVVSD